MRIIASSGVALMTSLAFAGVGGGGIGVGGTPPTGPFTGVSGSTSGPTWEIGSASAPIEVFPDPTAPYWTKDFILDVNNSGVQAGNTFELCEWITILPNTAFPNPITDWHEEINTDFADGGNWEWEFGTIETFSAAGGGGPLPGLNPMTMGPDIWFFFDPIFPQDLPLTIKITKLLVWTGPDIAPGAANSVRFQIDEYFTPTPGSIAMLAVAGLAACRRRR